MLQTDRTKLPQRFHIHQMGLLRDNKQQRRWQRRVHFLPPLVSTKMSEEGEERENKHENNPTRLLAKVLDKVDLVLTLHGMGFREEKSWEDFGEAIRALLFEYYDDYTGGDSSYEPGDSGDVEEDDEDSGESESATLESSSDTAAESPMVARRKRPRAADE